MTQAQLRKMQFKNLIKLTQSLRTDFYRLTVIRSGVPDNPFRGNWYKPVINNFLVKAAKEGKGGIGFPVGKVIADRYNLSKAVDAIEWDTWTRYN
jgi:hypothetical protein